MRKVLFTAAFLLFCFMPSKAQTNVEDFAREHFGAWGIHTGMTGWGPALGVHGDFTFKQFRGRAGAEMLIDKHPGLGANIAAHYLFELPLEGLNVYPIVGISSSLRGSHHDQSFHFGLDFGAGVEYNFPSGWTIFIDGKYDMKLIGDHVYYRTYFGFSKAF